MTAGEWAGVLGAILAVGSLAERIASRLTAAPAAPRETVVPPAPSHPSLQDATLAALSSRVERVERDVSQALDTVNDIALDVRGLTTLIQERTTKGGSRHGTRDSS